MRGWAKAGGQVLVSALVVLGMLGAPTPAGAQSQSAAEQQTATTRTSGSSATAVPSTASGNGGGAPAPTITNPSGPVLTNATRFAIAGTAQAASLVQVYLDVNQNGKIDKNESTPLGSQQLTSGATAFSISVPLASNSASAFLVTATLNKVDSKPTSVPPITQDATPPAVSMTAPTANAVTSSRNLAANAADANGLASVQFQLSSNGGTSWSNVGTAVAATPYSTTLSKSQADGAYQVRAQATDSAGNQATSATVSFTLDTTAPATPLVTDPLGPITVSATGYAIKGTAEANSLVRVWIDTNANGQKDTGDQLAVWQQLGGGSAAFSITVNMTTNAANAFLVTATDAAGNESPVVVVPTITQDSIGLSISALTVNPPAFSPNGDGVKDTTHIGYTLSAGATVTVRIYDSATPTPNLIRTLINAQPRSAGMASETWDGKSDGGQTAADATYTVKIDATDSLGTPSPEASTSVALDTTPPDTTIISQPQSSTTSTSASFGFSSTEPNSTFQCVLDSNPDVDCSTGLISYSNLVAGSHTFSVEATDAAGNTDPTPARYSWTVTRLLELLTDDFNDNSQDTAKWRTGNITGYTGDPSTTVRETSGQLQITTASPADTGVRYSGYTSVDPWCLTGSYAAIKVVQAIQQNSTDTIFAVGIQEATDADHFSWLVEGTTLYFLKRDSGTQTILFSTTYSPITHLWWRIREAGGTVYADTSADGSSWTNRASTTVSWSTGNVYAELNAGAYGTDPAGTAIFDDFNVLQ
jgi:flagellar hook assembly protein FlgD